MYIEGCECLREFDLHLRSSRAETVAVHQMLRERSAHHRPYQQCPDHTILEDIIEDESECDSELHHESDDFVSDITEMHYYTVLNGICSNFAGIKMLTESQI